MSVPPTFTIRRRGMSGAVAAVMTLALLLFYFCSPEWMAMAVMFLAGGVYFPSLLLRMKRASNRPLAIEDDILVQRDAAGREVGRVSLTRPFEVEYPFKGYFQALYRIRQDGAVLTFTEKTPGAEHLVRDVLGLQWPPIGQAWT
jgi:hypothetical protein